MHKKFKSIAHPNDYGYAYDSDAWQSSSSAPFLNSHFRMFQTYGDGLTQHSGDWAVTEDYAIDFLNSLAAAMLADDELAEAMEYKTHYTVRASLLKFAASLVYSKDKDSGFGKTRYFSVQLEKVTRNREKQHDDRYNELQSWHTGSPESIFSLVVPEYASGYERWQLADAVRTWAAENLKNSYMEMPAVFLKWFKEDSRQARAFRDAHEACQGIAAIVRMRKNGAAQVDNYRREIERKAAQAAAPQADEPLQLTAGN